MQRVCKLLSAAGVCSRREAELLIEHRRLSLRNEIVVHPAVKLCPADLSQLTIDGRTLDDVLGGAGFAVAAAVQHARLWRLHKPVGTIVSTAAADSDTVFQLDSVRALARRVLSVGRLDVNTSGLLLLTNCGQLKQALEQPSNNIARCYLATIAAIPHPSQLQALRSGIALKHSDRLRGSTSFPSLNAQELPPRPHRHMRSSAAADARHRLRPIHAEIVEGSRSAASCTVQLCLREGVNREVRRVCEHFGWPLVTLSRASYGPWNLADLLEGQVEEVPNKLLQQQLQDMHLRAGRGVSQNGDLES